ncbi:MAG: glycosyltransferase family 2 protein [Candidatus Micrarchaeota archaeon]|nr:glycosyltransferase family 2 protein [Candidatus Micrarchaeota archaeon]
MYFSLFQAYLLSVSLVAAGMLFLGARSYVPKGFKAKHSPKTLVIVPCRGEDVTLEKNLRAINDQSYPNYDLICVVDDESDLSLKAIKKLRLKYILSSAECRNCSGKVRAIATALEKFRSYSAYAIADSDILPEKEWLGNLLAPLSDKKIGLSTGYPFFNPLGGFWSKVKSAWGLVGEGLMESKLTVFGWGGSLAFRKELLDQKSLGLFKESLSDDIALTKISKKKALEVFYSKNARLQVNVKEGAGEFVEWANRQTSLSILGDNKIFYFGIAFYSAQILVLLSGIFLGIFYNILFLLLLLPILVGTARGYLRLRKKYPEFFIISPLLPFLYLLNLLVAKNMKEIKWRGNKYPLKQY